ncbi:MAG: hypothetical protein RML95_11620 [Anaerolineae bacterium]|nr:hypothetical protein [Anaerolineae bacterium]
MAVGQTWLSLLPKRPPIGSFRPLARFHQQVLVIGIGDSGAKVIELLMERLQDTQIAAQSAQPAAVENQPEFLHIAFEKLPDCRQLATSASSFVLTDDIVPPANAKNSVAWQWLTQNPLAGNQRSRRSARIALFNHLQMGRYALLSQALQQKLSNINAIFIVASAIEFAGAQLIGDIAALARLLTTNPLAITALVALEDSTNSNLQFAINDVPHYQAAALYELRRWSTEAHRYWRLGDQPDLIHHLRGQNLVDRAIACYGENGIGLNRIAQFIWASLTSQPFAFWQSQHVRTDRSQSITLFYSRALQWHTRLLRNIYTERLMLALIGTDSLPANPFSVHGRSPSERAQQFFNRLEEWLDGVRDHGLLPTLRSVRQQVHDTAATYLDNLINVFRQARTQAENALRQTITQIDRIDREQELGYFLVPLLDVNTWKTIEPPSEAVAALRQHVGWTRSDTPDYPLRMAFQAAEEGRVAFLQQIMPHGMPQYVQKVRELAERVASQYVAREAQALLANLAQPTYEPLAKNWAGYYARWQGGLGQHYDINVQSPTPLMIVVNEPGPMWRPAVAPTPFPSTDPAFALQGLIVHGVAVNGLRITRNGANGCRLFNTQHLVDLPEVLTFLYFNTLDVDVRLQNALAEQEFFKLFAECLVRDCYDDICEDLGLERREAVTDWLSVLERFMRQISMLMHRQSVEYAIRQKERLPADQLAAHLPNGDENARLIARAVRKALNLQEYTEE